MDVGIRYCRYWVPFRTLTVPDTVIVTDTGIRYRYLNGRTLPPRPPPPSPCAAIASCTSTSCYCRLHLFGLFLSLPSPAPPRRPPPLPHTSASRLPPRSLPPLPPAGCASAFRHHQRCLFGFSLYFITQPCRGHRLPPLLAPHLQTLSFSLSLFHRPGPRRPPPPPPLPPSSAPSTPSIDIAQPSQGHPPLHLLGELRPTVDLV